MGNQRHAIEVNDHDLDIFEVEFLNAATGQPGDMSAGKLVGGWIQVDSPSVSAEFVWPATGAPAGAVGWEVTNQPNPTWQTEGTPYEASDYETEPRRPNGSGGRTIVVAERVTAYARPIYTRTSGGAGADLKCFVALMR
jgi:hypothetical protein